MVQVGVSDYVSSFTLEQQAHNKGYTDPDMKGHPAEGSCCIVGEDDILVSGIDMSAVCNEMNKLGLAVTTEVSFLDCGRLVWRNQIVQILGQKLLIGQFNVFAACQTVWIY